MEPAIKVVPAGKSFIHNKIKWGRKETYCIEMRKFTGKKKIEFKNSLVAGGSCEKEQIKTKQKKRMQ